MNVEEINRFQLTEEFKLESEKYKNSKEYQTFLDFLTKIPINTKYYNNSNKYNATYAQLYKRKQGSNIESATKKMNVLLNRITNINVDDIVIECKKLLKECPEIISKMIESIFIKCSAQHSLCLIYIELLLKLPQDKIKEIIQRKTELYLNKILENNEDTEKSKEMTYDDFCDRIKQKSFWNGYSLFITHLHNKKYIELIIINKMLDVLVDKIMSESSFDKEIIVQCLHAICMNIDELDKLEAYIPLLQEIIDTGKLSIKLEFQIQDILDRFR